MKLSRQILFSIVFLIVVGTSAPNAFAFQGAAKNAKNNDKKSEKKNKSSSAANNEAPANADQNATQNKDKDKDDPTLKGLTWRLVGPFRGGRVVAVSGVRRRVEDD
jgi:hypothetical protein